MIALYCLLYAVGIALMALGLWLPAVTCAFLGYCLLIPIPRRLSLALSVLT